MSKRTGNNRLPSVTSDIPRDLRMFLDRVRETLVSADDVREIIRTPGPGGPGGPNDPVDPPTTPVGLFAIGQPGAIQIKWEPAPYRGHNHTEVWASPVDDRRQAEAVGMAPGASYIHSVGSEVGRYYWIRFVNRNGVFGPYNGEAGTYGEALNFEFPEPPIKELDESRLTQLLDERLRWIEDPTFGLRGDAARIRGEFNALMDGTVQDILGDLHDIKNELDGILVTEAFDPTKGYDVGDLVVWLDPVVGTSYIYQCKQEIPEPVPPATAPLPSDEDYWNQVGDSAAIQAIVEDIAAAGLQLQARELLDENGNVIGSMAAVLLATRAVLEDAEGNLLSAGALLALTSRVSTAEGKILALATAMIEAGVLVEENGVLVTSQAFLTLVARIETLASNMLGNAEFMQADKGDADWPNEPPEQWTVVRNAGADEVVGTNFSVRASPRSGDGVRALFLSSASAMSAGQSIFVVQAGIPVTPGGYYQASVYVGSPLAALRARVRITFDDAGAASFASPDVALTATGLGPDANTGTTPNDYNRLAVFAQSPVGSKTATFTVEITPGTVNPAALYATRPFFGPAVENQDTPSPWVPGVQSNAYRAAAAAALALDLQYRSPDGPFASSTAFLQLKGQIEADETGLAATNNIALGVKSVVENPETGLAATAGALDSLRTEVQEGPNSLTALATRISGVAATVGNNRSNLLQDVPFAKVDALDQTGAPWVRTSTGGWASPTFSKNAAGYAIQRIPENVAYIRKSGTMPANGSAQWHQDVPAVAGQWYQFSAWLMSLRCTASITLEFRSASASLGSVSASLVNTAGNGTTIAGYTRRHVALAAPSGTTLARLTIMAASATGADPHIFALRPFFGEAVANQPEPSPWLPPLADAFAFQELQAAAYDDETGLAALGSLIQGVDNQINDIDGDLIALSGAFNGLKAEVSIAYENRLLRSEQFAVSPWVRSNVNVTDGAEVVPGIDPIATPPAAQTASGSRLRETSTNGEHFVYQENIPVEGGYAHTASVHAKSVGGRSLIIAVVAQTANGVATGIGFWSFDLTTGAFVGTSGNTGMTEQAGAVTSIGSAWHRCVVSFRVSSTTTKIQLTYITSRDRTANYSSLPSFSGSASAGLDLFGAQVNAGRFPDGYRKTLAEALYGPLGDRVRAVASAITAVDTDLIDPVTGQRLTGAAFNTLRSYAGPGGTLSETVNGIQAGAGPSGNLTPDAVLETPVAGPVETSGPTAEMPGSPDAMWSFYSSVANQWRMLRVSEGDMWRLDVPFGNTLAIAYKVTTPAAGTFAQLSSSRIPVEAGVRYQMSFYSGAHRCIGIGYIYWHNAAGAFIGASQTGTNNSEMPGGKLLAGYKRLSVFAVPPTQAVSASVIMRAQALSPSQNNPFLFVARPYFGTAKADQIEPSDWAAWNEPPIFAAMQAKGVVWADADGEGTAGAIYTLKLRAKDNTGEAQVGFGLGALKENGKWVSDVRFSSNRFAIMDPVTTVDQNKTAKPWATATPYAVGDVVSYFVQGDPYVSGVFKCNTAHLSGMAPTEAYWTRVGYYPFIVEGGKVYINTAIIKTASIGTLLLEGNAVTVPVYISSVSANQGNNNWIVLGGLAATISNPLDQTMRVMLMFSARQDYTVYFPDRITPGTGFAIRQSTNGATPYVISSPAGQLDIPLCIQANDYLVWTCQATIPALSTATFTPEWFAADNTVWLRQKAFLVLGVKR